MYRFVFGPLLLSMLALGDPTARAQPPNIVFLFADDLGIGDLGVTGQLARAQAGLPSISTPNIDALAAESLQFTGMYSSASVCAPSRASLLTGFDHSHITKEFVDGFHGLRPGKQDRTWSEILQDAGYLTSMFGKWHLGGVGSTGDPAGIANFEAIPTQHGFEEVFGGMLDGYRPNNFWEDDGQGGLQLTPNDPDPSWNEGPGQPVRFSEDVVTDRVVQFIGQRADEQFAAYVAFKAPHEPLNAVEMNPLYADQDWIEQHKQYASLITNLDAQVGRVLDALADPNGDGDESDSVAENTLVVFASDNGPLWSRSQAEFSTEFFDSNSIYNGQKTNNYEGGIRSPFFVRWTGTVEPGVNDSHVGTITDILPTFAELVGEESPVGIDGVSMLPAIQGGVAERPDVSIWQATSNFRNLNQAGWAIRVGDWKLIWRVFSQTYELFDLATDPSESTNLATARPDVFAALQTLAEQEDLTVEPFLQTGDEAQLNVFFTQYKDWSPQAGSNDFTSADNWSGGTQYLRAEHQAGGIEAMNWNSGPASNWIATIENEGPAVMQVDVASDAHLLGLELRGGSNSVVAAVQSGVELNVRNGLRIAGGALLQLDDAMLTTIREVEIRSGGELRGAGVVTGQQDVLAGIPEFQDQGLLEPHVINGGVVDVGYPDEPGILLVEGDYSQRSGGALKVGLFDSGAVAGDDHDQLHVGGVGELAGQLQVDFGDAFQPSLGDQFAVVRVDGGLHGAFDEAFAPSLDGGLALAIVQSATAVSLAIVDSPDADFDLDGDVDGADLVILQRGFGSTGASRETGDANGDGLVNDTDENIWRSEYGTKTLSPISSLQSVPEPGSVLLAGLAFTAICLTQRRRFSI